MLGGDGDENAAHTQYRALLIMCLHHAQHGGIFKLSDLGTSSSFGITAVSVDYT